MDILTRIDLLNLIKKDILKSETAIIDALKKDLGKSQFESVIAEIQITLNEISHTLKNIKKWTRPKKVSTPLLFWPAKSSIVYEPYGHVLIIAPWNYPFQLLLSPMIGAIAAGNKVTLKPSELSSHTEVLLKKIFGHKKYSRYIEVVTGGVEETTELLKRRFDYIFYTGNTHVGKIIMKAASEHLTPLTLELGGKSPVLITKNANCEVAARRIVWGKFMNVGQTCIAPDYILVDKSIKDPFVKALKQEILNFYGATPQESPDYGRIINHSHWSRLKKLIPKEVILGGDSNEKMKYIAPTVFYAKPSDPIMKEEIFGPLLPIIEVESNEKARQLILSKEKPLAFYIFSENENEAKQFMSSISFGGGVINDVLIHIANDKIPFGGVGYSGFGSYHGEYSFKTFSHAKAMVCRRTSFDFSLRYPPFFSKLKWLRFLMKLFG